MRACMLVNVHDGNTPTRYSRGKTPRDTSVSENVFHIVPSMVRLGHTYAGCISVCARIRAAGAFTVYSQVFIYRRPYLPLWTSRANTRSRNRARATAMHKNAKRRWPGWRPIALAIRLRDRCTHAQSHVTLVRSPCVCSRTRWSPPLARHARARARALSMAVFSTIAARSNLQLARCAYDRSRPSRPPCISNDLSHLAVIVRLQMSGALRGSALRGRFVNRWSAFPGSNESWNRTIDRWKAEAAIILLKRVVQGERYRRFVDLFPCCALARARIIASVCFRFIKTGDYGGNFPPSPTPSRSTVVPVYELERIRGPSISSPGDARACKTGIFSLPLPRRSEGANEARISPPAIYFDT